MRLHGSPPLPFGGHSPVAGKVSCQCPDPDSSLGQISGTCLMLSHCHTEPPVSAPSYRGQNSKLGALFKVLQPVSVHVYIQF